MYKSFRYQKSSWVEWIVKHFKKGYHLQRNPSNRQAKITREALTILRKNLVFDNLDKRIKK